MWNFDNFYDSRLTMGLRLRVGYLMLLQLNRRKSCSTVVKTYQHWWEGQMVVQRLLKCGKTISKKY